MTKNCLKTFLTPQIKKKKKTTKRHRRQYYDNPRKIVRVATIRSIRRKTEATGRRVQRET